MVPAGLSGLRKAVQRASFLGEGVSRAELSTAPSLPWAEETQMQKSQSDPERARCQVGSPRLAQTTEKPGWLWGSQERVWGGPEG